MTSQKKIIFGLLLCLLLIGKVQPQDCEEDYNQQYSLPNPMVNVTLTDGVVTSDQSIAEIANLFVTFSELIGQEVDMAEVQSEITNYLSNLDSLNSDLTLLASLTNADEIYALLTQMLTDLNEAYISFQNPVFSQYAYYTMQPLFLNAVLHVNVLTMLSFITDEFLGLSNDSEVYQADAISIYNSYMILLQQYSTNATAYRLSFISSLESKSETFEVECLEDGSGCDAGVIVTDNYFQDNFLSGDPVVWEENETGCFGFAKGALNSYTQAVSSGTSDFFNSLVTSYQQLSPASSVPPMQDPESSSFLRLFR